MRSSGRAPRGCCRRWWSGLYDRKTFHVCPCLSQRGYQDVLEERDLVLQAAIVVALVSGHWVSRKSESLCG